MVERYSRDTVTSKGGSLDAQPIAFPFNKVIDIHLFFYSLRSKEYMVMMMKCDTSVILSLIKIYIFSVREC